MVYVDDILVIGSDSALVAALLGKLSVAFKIRDLGTLGFFLGIETVRLFDDMLLSQRCYMADIIKCVGMTNCKPLHGPFISLDQCLTLLGYMLIPLSTEAWLGPCSI